MDDLEELLEFERLPLREDGNKFFGDQVGEATGESVFLLYSHRDA
jgi:hypothetical protein